ncbi:hypothetical protein [Polymorphum gilvum]|uniref:Bacterioferritin n=1 Tax=Polymorphum gilvum (strain LMG 25793 / CGMCC 1.9160 / SL003B-26A1) TaxID=991905 RepID=F2J0K0_POLGS|nr:hypothetical protein [Polymorphum gilvum]ADZ69668.1 Bacterioferritin [Polymorphum gilvum SL003B-26A1]
MSTRKASLDTLQKAVAMELSAAHQYQLHAHVLKDWGIDLIERIGEKTYIAKHMSVGEHHED